MGLRRITRALVTGANNLIKTAVVISGPIALIMVALDKNAKPEPEPEPYQNALPSLLPQEKIKDYSTVVFECTQDNRHAEIMRASTSDVSEVTTLEMLKADDGRIYAGSNTASTEAYIQIAKLFCEKAIEPDVGAESLSKDGKTYTCRAKDDDHTLAHMRIFEEGTNKIAKITMVSGKKTSYVETQPELGISSAKDFCAPRL